MNKILSQSQAEAVYRAMCELNNVGAELKATIFTRDSSGYYMRVFQDEGSVKVVDVIGHSLENREHYADQAAFAAAYGLDGKQSRQAVYTPGIGWQVQDHLGRRGNYETEAKALGA